MAKANRTATKKPKKSNAMLTKSEAWHFSKPKMDDLQNWDVLVGRIKDRWDKTQLRVQPFSDVEHRFAAGAQLCAEKDGQRQLLTIRKSYGKAGFWVCDCALPDSPAADALLGAQLFVHRSMRPKLENGQFYPDEIIGMSVETESGEVLGEVEEVLETPHYEIYATKTLMIPAVAEFLVKIDGASRRIIVRGIENLQGES